MKNERYALFIPCSSQPNKHFKRNFSKKELQKEGTKQDKIINQILCTGAFASVLQHNYRAALGEGAKEEYEKEKYGIRSNPRAQFHVQKRYIHVPH